MPISPKFHKLLPHSYDMQLSYFIRVSLLTAALATASLSSAHADPSPTPTPVSTMAEYKIALEKYRLDLKQFKINSQTYRDKVRQINAQFNGAMGKLGSKQPVGPVKSQSQRLDDVKAKKSAGLDAAIARDEAIRALGTPPTLPTPPAKPSKLKEAKLNR